MPDEGDEGAPAKEGEEVPADVLAKQEEAGPRPATAPYSLTIYSGKPIPMRWFGKVLPVGEVEDITDRLYGEARRRDGVMNERIEKNNAREKPKKIIFKTHDPTNGLKIYGHYLPQRVEVESVGSDKKAEVTGRLYDASIAEKQAKMQALHDKYGVKLAATDIYTIGKR